MAERTKSRAPITRCAYSMSVSPYNTGINTPLHNGQSGPQPIPD